MTALRIEPTPLIDLLPAAFNPRTIQSGRFEELKRSLATDPRMLEARPVIALPDGTVVCGNQRLLAARELGWDTIPAVTVDLDDERARLWMLRDNNEYGEWEDDELAALLRELEAGAADLELTGFPESELESLLAFTADEGRDPDHVPSPPVKNPRSRRGKVYALGRHRLMCGDATSPQDVSRLLAGDEPVLLVTDPPYGVTLDMEWRGSRPRAPGRTELSFRPREGHTNRTISGDDIADWSAAFELVPSVRVAYVWHADRHTLAVGRGLERIGFRLAQLIVWDKERFVFSRTHYQIQHEPCWYARRPGAPRFRGKKNQPTIWRHPSPKMLTGAAETGDTRADHPTQKPVALYARPLENHLRRKECFYEPFAGSGTALIAAEMTGRTCVAMELDPRYCDVARERWEAFAGG